MVINSISAGSIASSVWAQVTRTLSADPATDAGAATLVWTHAARQVTSLAPAFTDVTAVAQPLAAGAILDNRPAASKRRMSCFSSQSASMLLGTYNGTTFNQYSTNTANTFPVGVPSNNAICVTIKNSSVGSLNYDATGWDWI